MSGSAADRAETLALQALTFLAAEPERLGAFLSLSGMGPVELTQGLMTPETRAGLLGGVLDFLLADEPLLIAFATDAALNPLAVARARQSLPGAPVIE